MEAPSINTRLKSFSPPAGRMKTGGAIRIFPAAKSESQVIGTFDRLAAGVQRFEVVSQDGEVFIRPWLPPTSQVALGAFGSVDNGEEQALRAA